MGIYVIKETDGTIVNPAVNGDLDFFKEVFAGKVIEERKDPVESSEDKVKRQKADERGWRNNELNTTDSLYLLDDYPDKDKLKAYRQALRDWPSTADFPDKRPTLG